MPDLIPPLLIAITDRHLLKLPPEDWARAAIAGGVDLIQVREKDLSESELVEFASLILEGADPTRERFPGLRPRAKKRERNLEEVWSGAAGTNTRDATEPRGCEPERERARQDSPVPEGLFACQHGHFSAVLSAPSSIQINNAPNIARLLDCGLHLPEFEPIPDRAPHPLSRSAHSIESARRSTGVDFLIAGHIFATPSKSGLEPRGLEWLRSISAGVELPVVAIGGITAKNAAPCIEHGASGIAVISAIAASNDPRAAAAQLRIEIDRAWEQRHD